MKELDKLKKDWNKSDGRFPQYSDKDIYAMLHKGSSSIVKWILIISILEFLFWIALSFIFKDNPGTKKLHDMKLGYITIPMTILSYGIVLYFMALFYINYRKISVTDNVKSLMSRILKTRKAVSTYIFVNIAFIVVSSIIIFVLFFLKDAELVKALHNSEAHGNTFKFYSIYFGVTLLFLAVFVVIIWLFYRLIYGVLLKRLYRNYQELKKIDL